MMVTPPADRDIWTYAEFILKWIITPLCAMVVTLVVWAWKSKEKTQERLEETLTNHIRDDEYVHDKLFTESRKQGEDVREIKTRQRACKVCPIRERSI